MTSRIWSLSLVAFTLMACATRQPTAGPPAPPTAPNVVTPRAGGEDTLAAERDRFVREVMVAIAGRENEPAESVFANIRSLTGVRAGNLPSIMNMGYSRSLGVSCTHCHVTSEWASDAKPQKQVTRDMAAMVRAINGELLPRIANLSSARPVVNCTTCHRGNIKPALNLPM